MTKKLQLGIVAYNRPGYLKRCLESLKSQECDIHVFIDRSSCMDEMTEVCDFFNVYYETAYEHLGIAMNHFSALEVMFEYDRFVIMEDDVIVSPDYIHLMNVLLNQYEDDEDIFSVNCAFKNTGLELNGTLRYNDTEDFNKFWFADGFWTKKWERVMPFYDQYIDFVYNRPYEDRDVKGIKELFRGSGIKLTTQDAAKTWAMQKAGMYRISTRVARCHNIGEYGVNCTPEGYAALWKKEITESDLYFKGDKEINKFMDTGVI